MTELANTPSKATVRPFPLQRRCPMSPPPEYATLRETEPISKVQLKYNGREAWLLTRYEGMQQMLRDPRLCSDIADPGYPLQFGFPLELLQDVVQRTVLHVDPPEHTKHRMTLMPVRDIRRHRPRLLQRRRAASRRPGARPAQNPARARPGLRTPGRHPQRLRPPGRRTRRLLPQAAAPPPSAARPTANCHRPNRRRIGHLPKPAVPSNEASPA